MKRPTGSVLGFTTDIKINCVVDNNGCFESKEIEDVFSEVDSGLGVSPPKDLCEEVDFFSSGLCTPGVKPLMMCKWE